MTNMNRATADGRTTLATTAPATAPAGPHMERLNTIASAPFFLQSEY